jgi:trehalose 6-phosphate synthase
MQLRERGLKNRIGFFLHIPWPPQRLLLSLPFHQRLVRSMLAYDLIGFQTEDWLDSFHHYIEREMGGTVEPGGIVRVGNRSVQAAAFPIGIDAKDFSQAVDSPIARQAHDRLKKSVEGKHVIIGVDRLDYSKGLTERFVGYRRFLEEHDDCRGKVTFLQIAPPSRGEVHTYEHIREHLDELSGRINGEFAEVDWVPIRYVNQGYPREELAGFYRAAEIGLVTPLRDGMNLVAKEYVAAQDPENPGVLILSRFAGAALQLKEALLVNPYSKDEISDAIAKALDMPKSERIRRWRAMMDNVSNEDVLWWRKSFVSALQGDGAEPLETESEALEPQA